MKYFLHTSGSLEITPPTKRSVSKAHETEEEITKKKKNRLAYKVDNEYDPYKYKYNE